MECDVIGICFLFLSGLCVTSMVMAQEGPVNVAEGLPESSYSMSSEYRPKSDPYTPRGPSHAANGNTDGVYTAVNCIMTSYYKTRPSGRGYTEDRSPWWQVDLEKKFYVYNLKIWAMEVPRIYRMYPFSITVDNIPCVTSVSQPATRHITVNCTRPIYGQTVRLTRTSNTVSDFYLNMCEVQILVCNTGYYGLDCNLPCSKYCSSDGCFMNNGSCISCADGFWGNQCNNQCGQCTSNQCNPQTGRCLECRPGWYLDQCRTPCPATQCKDNVCDRQTGVCVACSGNFVGDFCDECKLGFYGDQCHLSCETLATGCGACDRDTGTCTFCFDNYRVPDCKVCKEGFYESSSYNSPQMFCAECSSRCASKSCNPETRKCNGCEEGYHGPRCVESCISRCKRCDQDSGRCTECYGFLEAPNCTDCLGGYYAQYRSPRQCTKCRGTCLNGTTCDKITGYCPACPPGKQGTWCKADCYSRQYGQNCSQKCGNCFKNEACDVVNGVCSRCKRGWKEPLCQEECENGTYGNNCEYQCGHCKDGAACMKRYGECQLCEPGWYLPRCSTPCVNGTYGENCTNRCGKCLDGHFCDKATGHCSCPAGRQPPMCDKDCQDKTYGKDCKQRCGRCKGDKVCDVVSGHCDEGCQPGWTDSPTAIIHLCKTACPTGFYGDRCNQTCGHCEKGSACTHDTGLCNMGCADGYTGKQCMKIVQKGGPNKSVVGGAIAAVILFIIVVALVVFFVMRKKYRGKHGERRRQRGHQQFSYSGDDVDRNSDPSIINTSPMIMATAGDAQAQDKIIADTMSAQPTNNNGVMYENIVLKQKPAVQKPKRNNIKVLVTSNGSSKGNKGLPPLTIPAAGENTPLQSDDEDADFDESLYANHDTLPNSQPTSIHLDVLQETIQDKLHCGNLDDEFLRMAPKKNFAVSSGQREANYFKNRFNSILPYDKNRVRLDQVDVDDASDYVNASFIRGQTSAKAYIAAQGPKQNTVDDFWRMVWQEGVTDIVMLTNVMEGAKSKCYQYWPEQGTPLKTVHMKIQAIDEQQRAHFIIRTFEIKKGKEKREVTQYHYVSWLDHEVPSTIHLVNFWRCVSARAPRDTSASPLIVHCSAGVGRTGTYIALDILFAVTQEQAEININQVVDRLRDDRCHMVQNKGQYAFLHEAVLEAYLTRGSRLQLSDLDTLFSHTVRHDVPNGHIDAEFQDLCKLRETQSQSTAKYNTANLPENQSKNRNPHVLPDDKHVVFLTQHVKGRNQYINAVHMPTFLQPRGCVLTQLPLTDTLIDMWRLIDGCNVSTVVALGDVESQPDSCQYWPKDGEKLKTGGYTISTQSRAHIGECLDSYTVILQKDKGEEQEVRVLHYMGWRGVAADNIDDLTHLLDTVHTVHDRAPFKPVVIQCLDGAVHSGVFCAIWDVISRLKCDQEIDVPLAVKIVIGVRPEAITSVEQYRFIYEVAQHYTRSLNVYVNA